eukprot:283661_1
MSDQQQTFIQNLGIQKTNLLRLDEYFQDNNVSSVNGMSALAVLIINNEQQMDIVCDKLWNYICVNHLPFEKQFKKIHLLLKSLLIKQYATFDIVHKISGTFCLKGFDIRHMIHILFLSVGELAPQAKYDNDQNLLMKLENVLTAAFESLVLLDMETRGTLLVRLDIIATVDLYHRNHNCKPLDSRIMSKIDYWSFVFFNSEKCFYDFSEFVGNSLTASYLVRYLVKFNGTQHLDLNKYNKLIVNDEQRAWIDRFARRNQITVKMY